MQFLSRFREVQPLLKQIQRAQISRGQTKAWTFEAVRHARGVASESAPTGGQALKPSERPSALITLAIETSWYAYSKHLNCYRYCLGG